MGKAKSAVLVGLVVELEDQRYVYYVGKTPHESPERYGPFMTKDEAIESLHKELEEMDSQLKKEGVDTVKKIEHVKENPNDDTLVLIKNLFEL